MVDSDFEAILDVLPPSDLSDPVTQRARVAQASAPQAALSDDRVIVRDEVVAAAVRVRTYTPVSAPSGTALFFHGGGFVMGTLDLEQRRCLSWAAEAGVLVVSVDYRLAPEHPYPAAVEDGEAVLSWLDGAAPLIVAGSSAGGCIAATLAARHRDAFALQLLICPVLDDRSNSASMLEFESSPGWNRRASVQAWRNYLGGSAPSAAAPARFADLSGQPPAFVVIAQLDPMRDEGFEHARRLAAAGVAVELHHVPDAPHGFDLVNPAARVSRAMAGREIAALRLAVQTKTVYLKS